MTGASTWRMAAAVTVVVVPRGWRPRPWWMRPAARQRTSGDRRRRHACDIPFRLDGGGDPFHDLLAWESEPTRRLPVGSPAGGDASIAVHGSPDAKGLMHSSTPRTLHDLWAGSPHADARDHLR